LAGLVRRSTGSDPTHRRGPLPAGPLSSPSKASRLARRLAFVEACSGRPARCGAGAGPSGRRTAPPPAASRTRGRRAAGRVGEDPLLGRRVVAIAKRPDREVQLRVAGRPSLRPVVPNVEEVGRPDGARRVTEVPAPDVGVGARVRRRPCRGRPAFSLPRPAKNAAAGHLGRGTRPAASRNVGCQSVRLMKS